MRSPKLFVLVLAVTAGAAFAQPAVAPPVPPVPAPALKGVAPKPVLTKKISVQHSGTVREGLRKIAEAAGINLVVTGKLDGHTELSLKDVSAEEALRTMAELHGLEISKRGNIWTAQVMTAEQAARARDAQEPASALDAEARAEAEEAMREAEEAAREAAADAREAAQEAAQEAREAAREAMAEAQVNAEELRERLKAFRAGRADGDAVGAGGPLVVAEGEKVKNAVSYGGPIDVQGHVEKDVVSFGGPITLGPKSVVGGDVVAFGGPINKAEGAVVEGDEISMGGPGMGIAFAEMGKNLRRGRHQHDDGGAAQPDSSESQSHDGGLSFIPRFLLTFALLFGVGFLAMMFAPGRMKLIETELKADPVRCGVTGLLGWVALIPLTVLMAVTIIGIPFVLAMYVMLGIGLAMGTAAVANEIGLRLPMRNVRKTQAVVLALGLLVLLLVSNIPILGGIVSAVISVLIMGALIRTRFGSKRMGVPEPMSAAA